MTCTTDDIEAVRDLVGSQPDDETVQAALDRFASTACPANHAALSILRRRRVDLVDEPQSWAVDGDYREAMAAHRDRLAALDARIARLERSIGDTAGSIVTSARFVAPDGAR